MTKNRPVDKLYKTIANAQKKLDVIRKKCKHKKTHIGLYSWRVGSITDAELCNTCDAVIHTPFIYDGNSQTFPVTISNGKVEFTIDNKLGEIK